MTLLGILCAHKGFLRFLFIIFMVNLVSLGRPAEISTISSSRYAFVLLNQMLLLRNKTLSLTVIHYWEVWEACMWFLKSYTKIMIKSTLHPSERFHKKEKDKTHQESFDLFFLVYCFYFYMFEKHLRITFYAIYLPIDCGWDGCIWLRHMKPPHFWKTRRYSPHRANNFFVVVAKKINKYLLKSVKFIIKGHYDTLENRNSFTASIRVLISKCVNPCL